MISILSYANFFKYIRGDHNFCFLCTSLHFHFFEDTMAEQHQNKETLDLINQGVHLKKVDAPPERKLPTAQEIAEARQRAETEGPEVDPEARPKGKDGRSMLELIRDGNVQLKKVDAPADRKLPTAQEIAEARKRAETDGPEIDPEAHPKGKDGRSMLELIREGDVHLKKVDTKTPHLPTKEEIEEQKRLAQEGK